jgi:hypothetical protein
MQNKTSLELSKWLQENGCTLESSHHWTRWNLFEEESKENPYELHRKEKIYAVEYPAYDLLWDICVKYAEEFFGDESIRYWITQDNKLLWEYQKAYLYHSSIILMFLQQGREWTEDYIKEHCKFNPKNK